MYTIKIYIWFQILAEFRTLLSYNVEVFLQNLKKYGPAVLKLTTRTNFGKYLMEKLEAEYDSVIKESMYKQKLCRFPKHCFKWNILYQQWRTYSTQQIFQWHTIGTYSASICKRVQEFETLGSLKKGGEEVAEIFECNIVLFVYNFKWLCF